MQGGQREKHNGAKAPFHRWRHLARPSPFQWPADCPQVAVLHFFNAPLIATGGLQVAGKLKNASLLVHQLYRYLVRQESTVQGPTKHSTLYPARDGTCLAQIDNLPQHPLASGRLIKLRQGNRAPGLLIRQIEVIQSNRVDGGQFWLNTALSWPK